MANYLPPNRGRAAPSTKQELERMEQQRLSQPCMRTLDLRGQVAGKCKEYQHGGRTHWMDERSIAIFEQLLARFRGQYTLGVYEALLASTKMAKSESGGARTVHADARDDEVMCIDFGYRPRRAESRMNYVSSVTMELENGNRLAGKTLDLSLLGLRLSPSANIQLPPGTPLSLHFDELQQKHGEPFGEIAYTVVATDLEQDRKVLRLKRQMRDSEREFDHFLPHFIESQSNRYKHELNDLLQVTYARAYDRLYGQRLQGLYAFFRPSGERIELEACAGPVEYALSETTPLIALAARQLARITTAAMLEKQSQIIVASRQSLHVMRWQGRVYALPADALQAKAQRDDWYRLMNESEESACYGLVWRKQPTLHQADIDEALDMLPESLKPHIADWQQRLGRISHSCALVPYQSTLRPEQRFDALPTQVPEWLKVWEVPRSPVPPLFAMGVRGQRAQERYLHKTAVQVDSENESVSGELVDFSINGLQLQLNRPGRFEAREIVKVSFPALQEKVKEPEELAQQAYRVVRSQHQGERLSLERDFRVSKHGAARFFTYIIQNNRHRLPRCTHEQQQIADARIAEMLVGVGLAGVPFVLSRDSEKRPYLFACGFNPGSSLLYPFGDDKISITSLNQRELLQTLLSEHCNNVGAVDKVRHALLKLQKQDEHTAIWSLLEPASPADERQMLQQALQEKARIFACAIAPVNPLPRSEFEALLKPVFNNSRYKADQFRAEISRVIGIGTLFDLTPALAHELQFPADAAAP
ncbi:PilZ domain-containing protein [Permianibacter aggregans]|uniref:PilZ domain-containing protein n=1 Tax=Permianibacter aggregans TaxID=1510150 RepID=A0A4R6UQM9_9GAMM|nr:PilZ domain-containing protein [Permianibacter aggregans]QGX40512.1 PilZ domain-containing protein [Permianibacter aggregans]TDQ49341.1 PilZ domain-containing protein [Permianibacter aggregans]